LSGGHKARPFVFGDGGIDALVAKMGNVAVVATGYKAYQGTNSLHFEKNIISA